VTSSPRHRLGQPARIVIEDAERDVAQSPDVIGLRAEAAAAMHAALVVVELVRKPWLGG
jgi:hypothetical protein